ncbi:MAG: hypothetical protein A2705_01510 [Omnitrophica WOR_2 bacterium RIFCSPHIGHO2_01_FULL_52_10]|nr:MAG: hypothetical protein A2705_01510 [Omnitrophica WOR_2 bacterium RIFCSPHIGHO2_01_FULL_52_10]
MSLRHRASEEDEILAQINVIPLVDVSLVLLIIFIVTVSHILTPSIRINLPQSTRASSMSGMETIDIVISNEGIIYLNDEIVTMKELEQKVAVLHKENPEETVVISVDKATYFQRVIDALDLLNGLGIAKLDIRTVKGN